MKFTNTIGIDVSKKILDIHDYVHQLTLQVNNNPAGHKELLKWVKQNNAELSEVLICFEHTGMYSLPLALYLTEHKQCYVMVPGLEIKRSMGISRGKNDSADALAIARYAHLRREEIIIYQLPSKQLLELKSLLSLREKMVSQRAGYQASKKEMKAFLKIVKTSSVIFDAQETMIKELNKQILRIEKQMMEIICNDEHLKKTFDLVTSVKGVGVILGTTMLVYTNCFTSFDDWRKFACYCGIAPFEYQSGTSIKGKTKISPFANKRLKSLLSNAACSSIQHNPEMKLYYERRIQEGKNKMSTQNIIRNKILARVFAVVNRGTQYVDTLKYAA
ncbi:MAG: IS110 family transposase [Cyclobacteriaceae bacterium]|nr:IS110 family transposase [Cyclobacteriaceae bacterium]MBX2955462.1 IS110 family transposase [Cyclobacteriaceae bacterium]MBX2955727.1 IS110 family transposase [Cyclobacteriaceae bacterium]MBX2957672.1 IS110 family transposase [Cyclobacteriaceae bacterium]MBX2958189.1 IS110 family transposase [Cyclobacteriaceae bacterium]